MGGTMRRQAADTLTAVEMDRGQTLEFRLRSGEKRTLKLVKTHAAIVEKVTPGGIVYHFTADVLIDGQPMRLQRYVCSQECFYEPYVVDGMRIWLDAVRDITDMIPMRKMETQRGPHKHARLAVQDATRSICPQRMARWYTNDAHFIDVGDCYNGDDCWLGPYLGKACHGGLDINHRKGEPLWAPIDLDDHWLFNSVAAGHNNNRWRGIRKWPGGDVWVIQTHHLVRLTVKEHTKLKRGTQYATAAGVWVGSHQHTHWVFKIRPKQGGPEIHLDPWILHWQIFEDARSAAGQIRSAMAPLAPAATGRAVQFSANRGGKLRCWWTFGDGGFATGPRPRHVFVTAGVYPVTLVVDDGATRAACTQHITVAGPPAAGPCLALAAPHEPSFRRRPVDATDVYGRPVKATPHTLTFVARRSRPRPDVRTVLPQNTGRGRLPAASAKISYVGAADWLAVKLDGSGNKQSLRVSPDATNRKFGRHEAVVTVAAPGAMNSPQAFRVVLDVRRARRATTVVVDDRDDGFYCTPHFWVGHRFCRCKRRGYRDLYLTNGGRPRDGEFARFTPDLPAGRYEVSFHAKTPLAGKPRFDVRVRHAGGLDTVRADPASSRRIGVFDFAEGTDGFVEIQAGGSTGLVIADAIVFRVVNARARDRDTAGADRARPPGRSTRRR